MKAAFEAILAASQAANLPRTFATDVTTHDRAAIEGAGDQTPPFLWCLYASGSHLIWARGRTASVSPVVKALCDGAAVGDFADAQWFVWDGSKLSPVRGGSLDVLDAFAEIAVGGAL